MTYHTTKEGSGVDLVYHRCHQMLGKHKRHFFWFIYLTHLDGNIKCSNGLFSSVWVTTGIWLGVMRRSWGLLVDGRSGDVVVGGALDDMVVVVSVISLKGNVWFCDLLAATFCCSLWRGDEGSPKKTERNDFFSCGRGLLMLTGRRYQKTSSPLAEGCSRITVLYAF